MVGGGSRGLLCAVINSTIFTIKMLVGFERLDKWPTYSLGFFLGPGLPRGLGAPSAGMGVDRFVPFVPLVPFTDDLGLGVPFGEGASCMGAGVECASDMFSCDRLCFRGAGSSMTGAGDDATEESSSLAVNRFSIDGGNVNMMTLVCVLVRPLAVGVEGIVPGGNTVTEVMSRNNDAAKGW